MSIQAMAWAFAQDPGSGTRKLVLLSLANAHNAHTGACFPSAKHIRKESSLADRTVRKALTELEELGFISRNRRRRSNGTLGVYDYDLLMEAEPAAASAEPPAPDDAGPPAPVAGLNHEVNLEPTTTPNGVVALADQKPPKANRINGRDLPFDALTEICDIDTRNKTQTTQAAKALKDIRGYFWEEVGPLSIVFGDPPYPEGTVTVEQYEEALARAILARANEYHGRWPDVDLTPTALAKWWHQMARPSQSKRVVTDVDRARIVADERPGPMEEFRQRLGRGEQ